jgi:hypothetical protein
MATTVGRCSWGTANKDTYFFCVDGIVHLEHAIARGVIGSRLGFFGCWLVQGKIDSKNILHSQMTCCTSFFSCLISTSIVRVACFFPL